MDAGADGAFLRDLQPAATDEVLWPGDRYLRVQTYITDNAPPSSLLTSARALVFREGQVLVLTDQSPATHILPGGRIEPGEEPRETARREVGEESGWEVVPGEQIGVLFFRHLQAKPDAWPYLYPVFFQVVYSATALRFNPELLETNGWETDARFMAPPDAVTLPLTAGERALLACALERGNARSTQPSTE
jgi:8-oxo-dGTP pyrophosphatase MutT (NUDIX family)